MICDCWLGLWAGFGCIFLCPGCGLVSGFVCFPGLWGFAWLFCWLCPYAGVGFVGVSRGNGAWPVGLSEIVTADGISGLDIVLPISQRGTIL